MLDLILDGLNVLVWVGKEGQNTLYCALDGGGGGGGGSGGGGSGGGGGKVEY